MLLSHPLIVDVAVIGVEMEEHAGELPRAYVVKRKGKQGQALTGGEVKGFLKGRLARYKWLEGGVVFLDEVPKTASGKILKRVLREQAKKEMKAKL